MTNGTTVPKVGRVSLTRRWVSRRAGKSRRHSRQSAEKANIAPGEIVTKSRASGGGVAALFLRRFRPDDRALARDRAVRFASTISITGTRDQLVSGSGRDVSYRGS